MLLGPGAPFQTLRVRHTKGPACFVFRRLDLGVVSGLGLGLGLGVGLVLRLGLVLGLRVQFRVSVEGWGLCNNNQFEYFSY